MGDVFEVDEGGWSTSIVMLLVVLAAPVGVPFWIEGYGSAGIAAWIALFVLCVCAIIVRRSFRETAFWVTATALITAQLCIVTIARKQIAFFPPFLMGPMAIGLCILDFLIFDRVQRLLERSVKGG